MTEEQFWKCTPRKLDELFKIYKEVNGVNERHNEDIGYIDDVFF